MPSVTCWLSESDDSNSNNRILWRLDAGAKVPGVDYFAQFEVPVFRTSETAATADASIVDPTLAYQAPPEPYKLPPQSRIQVRETPQGGKEFVFPALLNPGVALVVSAIGIGCIKKYFPVQGHHCIISALV